MHTFIDISTGEGPQLRTNEVDLAKTRVGLGFRFLSPPMGYPGWVSGVPNPPMGSWRVP
ncbi:hypothetical protein BDV33DRAFT_183450, partial [Aspergillus novoparasiticus]